jgi:hypothetical protein
MSRNLPCQSKNYTINDCLTCTLPDCAFGGRRRSQVIRIDHRRNMVANLIRDPNTTISAIAAITGFTKRTILRDLKVIRSRH